MFNEGPSGIEGNIARGTSLVGLVLDIGFGGLRDGGVVDGHKHLGLRLLLLLLLLDSFVEFWFFRQRRWSWQRRTGFGNGSDGNLKRRRFETIFIFKQRLVFLLGDLMSILQMFFEVFDIDVTNSAFIGLRSWQILGNFASPHSTDAVQIHGPINAVYVFQMSMNRVSVVLDHSAADFALERS